MRKSLICLLTMIFCSCYSFCSEEQQKENPGIALNSQDIPIFFEKDNPLTGMHAFNLIPPLSLNNPATVQKVIEKELEELGDIIHLQEADMRGMGSGNILNIQVGDVLGCDNNPLSISRVSLQVETFIVINKTGVKTFPVVWSINTFFEDSPKPEEVLLKAVQRLVRDFIQNYRYANQNQQEKPVFYTYY